jgi:hypothetical protein
LPGRLRSRDPEAEKSLTRLEAAVYMALLKSGREPPWEAVRRRIDEWPWHLEQPLLEWLCATPAEREPENGLRSALPSDPWEAARQRRRDALSILLAPVAERESRIVERCRALQSSPDRPSIAGSVRALTELEDDLSRWSLFCELAALGGWQNLWSTREIPADSPVAKHLASNILDLIPHRRRLHTALEALARRGRLHAVVGDLWPLLAPNSPERRTLLDQLLSIRDLPACVPIDELLDHLDRKDGSSLDNHWGIDLPSSLNPRYGTRLTPEHEARLRELASTGLGPRQLVALLYCAERDSREAVDALASAIDTADPITEGLAPPPEGGGFARVD